jgi:APA family basic amino acid/polyamine antiporter
MSQVSPEPPQRSNSLRREVGVFGATMMGLGAIVGTGIFVSIGNATSVAGTWVVVRDRGGRCRSLSQWTR